jgi:hypothetical protein
LLNVAVSMMSVISTVPWVIPESCIIWIGSQQKVFWEHAAYNNEVMLLVFLSESAKIEMPCEPCKLLSLEMLTTVQELQ